MNGQTDLRSVKIGEMLIQVGALSSGDLTEAIQISKRMGVPIGRVLVMSGCVTESNLQQTLELQSLLKDELVDLETAFKALHLVFSEKLNAQDALKQLNWQPKQDQAGNKLGDLLIDSMIVTRSQLERALETSFQSGMPLGGTLVLQGVLSAQLLPTVLNIQERIRESLLSREDALEELKRALMFWAKAELSKQDKALQKPSDSASPVNDNGDGKKVSQASKGINTLSAQEAAVVQQSSTDAPPQPTPHVDTVSLVELLMLSGFCSEATLQRAIEEALFDGRLASKLLLAIGFIDAPTLNSYVHVQALIARGRLRADQALYVLNSMRQRKIGLEQALAELGVAAAL